MLRSVFSGPPLFSTPFFFNQTLYLSAPSSPPWTQSPDTSLNHHQNLQSLPFCPKLSPIFFCTIWSNKLPIGNGKIKHECWSRVQQYWLMIMTIKLTNNNFLFTYHLICSRHFRDILYFNCHKNSLNHNIGAQSGHYPSQGHTAASKQQVRVQS